jgi:molecular chaperone HtpG
MEKAEFMVATQSLGENASPIMITQSEYMRRMKEMATIQAGMSFYGEMPDMFNLVLNSDHALIKEVLSNEEAACASEVAAIQSEIKAAEEQRDKLSKQQEGKKDEEISVAEKDELEAKNKQVEALKSKKNDVYTRFANDNKVVKQLIDLALLQNGMLKGEALNNFVKRSIEMIK